MDLSNFGSSNGHGNTSNMTEIDVPEEYSGGDNYKVLSQTLQKCGTDFKNKFYQLFFDKNYENNKFINISKDELFNVMKNNKSEALLLLNSIRNSRRVIKQWIQRKSKSKKKRQRHNLSNSEIDNDHNSSEHNSEQHEGIQNQRHNITHYMVSDINKRYNQIKSFPREYKLPKFDSVFVEVFNNPPQYIRTNVFTEINDTFYRQLKKYFAQNVPKSILRIVFEKFIIEYPKMIYDNNEGYNYYLGRLQTKFKNENYSRKDMLRDKPKPKTVEKRCDSTNQGNVRSLLADIPDENGRNNSNSEYKIIDICSSNDNQSQPVVDNGSENDKNLFKKLKRFHHLTNGNQNANKSTDECAIIEDKCAQKSQSKRKICSSPSGLFKKQTISESPSKTPNKNTNIDETESSAPISPQFITGREKQIVDRFRKTGDMVEARQSLTATRQFIAPIKSKQKYNNEDNNVSLLDKCLLNDSRLKNIDPKMIELIENEIIESKSIATEWNDIAGLENVKKKLKEILVLPLIRPDLFTGIRTPPKGLLLFGPPGTGKTLIGRCVASQSHSTFFSITASSLTSKWIGVGEKMVKAMFAVSRVKQPSVIFIDEIDSLLTQRCDSEHESSRRLKTEFLAQFDGVNTASDDRVLIIGATNRPQELDEAARRRFTSRIYIPLPDITARKQIIENCLKAEKHSLTEHQMVLLSERTEGYSGADMFNLCRESAMESYRDDSLLFDNIDQIEKNEIRAINYNDFVTNFDIIRPSVCNTDLQVYETFNNKFGFNLQKK